MPKTTKKSKKSFPKPVSLLKLMGPSFIILALGLGSGEVILWPYMTANWGLGIVWGALVGITFQFFMNMEIERYALVKGESVFVGFAKLWKKLPYWFIVSTFLGFGLPGIIAASSQVFSHLFGFNDIRWLAIIFLILIGIILSIGKTVYTMMERITKTIIFIGVPFVFILALYLVKWADVAGLFAGFAGQGDGYSFLPVGISMATFLGAFAYAGAGGNLNLTQSIYIKEKGYGMGKYSQKIAGLFHQKKHEKVKLTGEEFAMTPNNIKNFKSWWRRINTEHFLVFWLLGITAMSLLMLLSYVTAYGMQGNDEGIMFVINEGLAIGRQTMPFVGGLFLFVVGVMLFQTQLGVMDSTSRIMAENLAIKLLQRKNHKKINLSKIYFSFVWAQITFGIILFLFNITDPKMLIVLGAVINAFAMFVHVGLTYRLNMRELPKEFRPRVWRRAIIWIVFAFFGVFSAFTFISKIF